MKAKVIALAALLLVMAAFAADLDGPDLWALGLAAAAVVVVGLWWITPGPGVEEMKRRAEERRVASSQVVLTASSVILVAFFLLRMASKLQRLPLADMIDRMGRP